VNVSFEAPVWERPDAELTQLLERICVSRSSLCTLEVAGDQIGATVALFVEGLTVQALAEAIDEVHKLRQITLAEIDSAPVAAGLLDHLEASARETEEMLAALEQESGVESETPTTTPPPPPPPPP
jgi:hypothetical protein